MAKSANSTSELSKLQQKVDNLATVVDRLQRSETSHRKVAEELHRFNEILIGMWNELRVNKPSKIRAMSQLLTANAHLRPFGLATAHCQVLASKHYDECTGDGEAEEGDERDEKDEKDETPSIVLSDSEMVSREYTSGDDVLLVQYMDRDGEMVRVTYCTAAGVFRSEWVSVASNDKVIWKRLCEKSCPDSFTQLESGWIIGWDEGVFWCRSATGESN